MRACACIRVCACVCGCTYVCVCVCVCVCVPCVTECNISCIALRASQMYHRQIWCIRIRQMSLSCWLKHGFTSTGLETVGLIGSGAQDIHLDFHTAPELCEFIIISNITQENKYHWCCLCSLIQSFFAVLWSTTKTKSFLVNDFVTRLRRL